MKCKNLGTTRLNLKSGPCEPGEVCEHTRGEAMFLVGQKRVEIVENPDAKEPPAAATAPPPATAPARKKAAVKKPAASK